MKTETETKTKPTHPPTDITTLSLSELWALALRDARKVSKRRGYVLNMGLWHFPDGPTNTCHVCLAGSVAACELSLKKTDRLLLTNFPQPVIECLLAIDQLRHGWISCAYRTKFGIVLDTPDVRFFHPSDPSAILRNGWKLTKYLQKMGL